jgi:hypothetical protein
MNPRLDKEATSTKPAIGTQEKDLLLPFELEHIPEFYKDYYKIKRNNFFASIQAFPTMWRYYLLLGRIWQREFEDLKPPGDPTLLFPLMLFINAHAKIRVSLELAFAGCMAEARSILRDGIEFVAHAHKMAVDSQIAEGLVRQEPGKRGFQERLRTP